ncbi:GNAT family N-acetyltransferase [Peribacillus sp. NPDC097295]|uniref:GNAT family N-acetyltransferase n=1 Tax=Peribacillus sp. NPDC097295 TaxID=3364402 RepID=UPI003802C58B
MAETIVPMTMDDIEPCIELYIDVFNSEPWNERWTYSTTKERLTDFIHTPKYLGYLLYEENQLIGLVAGNGKKTDVGVTFYLAELCISNRIQGKGYGTILLRHLEKELKNKDIHSLYLLTAHGGVAETFYRKNGYEVHRDRMVLKKSLV